MAKLHGEYTSEGTARLRALSPDERKRRLVEAYRDSPSQEETAARLGIPTRTLWRMLKELNLFGEFAKIRAKRNGSSQKA